MVRSAVTEMVDKDQPQMLLNDRGSHGGHSVWVLPSQSALDADKRAAEEAAQEVAHAQQAALREREEEEMARPGMHEAMARVDAERLNGNEAFKAGRQEEAVTHYRSALQILLHPPLAATRVANKAAVTLRCNVAASLLKQGAASGAIDECTHALVMDKHHVKAMFRRAEAYRMLGLYSKAVADLDKARTLEPRNQAIQYALEDAEDLLEEEGDVAPAEAAAVAKPATAQCVSPEFKAGAEAFALKCMDTVRKQFASTGEVLATAYLYHGDPTLGSDDGGLGMMTIEGAFQSSDLLSQALEFVRGQHTTNDATCGCVVVRKSTMLYPLVWWAGSWPFDVEQDGVLCEVTAPNCKHLSTWFMPLGGGRGVALGDPVRLDDDCAMLLDVPSLFP